MTQAIRWRIIVLQVLAVLVLGFAAGGALYAHAFIDDQVQQQLAPQQIYFPATAQQGLPASLRSFAGQQVLTGAQAHAYAEQFIGLHLRAIGQGHPYAYWSGLALREPDPAAKAHDQALADTLFKGETLKSLLNTAWTLWVIGQLAFYAFLGLLVATLVVLATLIFELIEVRRGTETARAIIIIRPDRETRATTAPMSSEQAAIS